MHTLPVLSDYYPVGPLEAGLQLPQVTRGLAGGHAGGPLVIQNQSALEAPRRPQEASVCGHAAERMAARSKVRGRNEGGEEIEDPAKVRDQGSY